MEHQLDKAGWRLIGVSDNKLLFAKGRGRSERGVIVDGEAVRDIGSPQAALARVDWLRPTKDDRLRAKGVQNLVNATPPRRPFG